MAPRIKRIEINIVFILLLCSKLFSLFFMVFFGFWLNALAKITIFLNPFEWIIVNLDKLQHRAVGS